MAKSPEELAQTMIDNLPEKTGKSLAEWQTVVNASGLAEHGEIMKLLKGEHGGNARFRQSHRAKEPRQFGYQ